MLPDITPLAVTVDALVLQTPIATLQADDGQELRPAQGPLELVIHGRRIRQGRIPRRLLAVNDRRFRRLAWPYRLLCAPLDRQQQGGHQEYS